MSSKKNIKLEVSVADFDLIKNGKMKCVYISKEYGDSSLRDKEGIMKSFDEVEVSCAKKKLTFHHAVTNMIGHGYIAFHGSKTPRKFLNDTYRVFINPITNEESTDISNNQTSHATE